MSSTDSPALLANASDLAVLLIDVQPRFLATMHAAAEPVLARLEQLLIICEWFELPVLATLEEPVAEKGPLDNRLARHLPDSAVTFTKQCYGIANEPKIVTGLEQLGRPRLVVAGSETDVCVLQSVLGLIELGYEVFLLEDCLFSSEPNTGPAVARMRQAGAVSCTYKMLYYELLKTDDPGAWSEQQSQATSRGFVAPESLPPLA
jgi:nicotinamidase-related amidase